MLTWGVPLCSGALLASLHELDGITCYSHSVGVTCYFMELHVTYALSAVQHVTFILSAVFRRDRTCLNALRVPMRAQYNM